MYTEQGAQKRSELENLVRNGEEALSQMLGKVSWYRDEIGMRLREITDRDFAMKVECLIGGLDAQKATTRLSMKLVGNLNLPPTMTARPPLPKGRPEEEKPKEPEESDESDKKEEKDEATPA